MAHPGDPNKAGSQFYIVLKDHPELDGKYTIFGKVVSGMEIVDDIAKVPTDNTNIPMINVVIEKAYIIKT